MESDVITPQELLVKQVNQESGLDAVERVYGEGVWKGCTEMVCRKDVSMDVLKGYVERMC